MWNFKYRVFFFFFTNSHPLHWYEIAYLVATWPQFFPPAVPANVSAILNPHDASVRVTGEFFKQLSAGMISANSHQYYVSLFFTLVAQNFTFKCWLLNLIWLFLHLRILFWGQSRFTIKKKKAICITDLYDSACLTHQRKCQHPTSLCTFSCTGVVALDMPTGKPLLLHSWCIGCKRNNRPPTG